MVDHDFDTVLVTGALGGVGQWVVDRLADSGTHVVGVDLERPEGTRSNTEFWAVDLTERGLARETIDEVDPDAVVHLAAVSDPVCNPDSQVFDNNVTSSYNVLTAAGQAGLDIVWTSSQAAYGALFAESTWTPAYLPIDEAHECRPEDAYGLSKVCGEEIAQSVVRRHDVTVTTIRPATIFGPDRTRRRPHRDDTDLTSDAAGRNFGSFVDIRDVARMVEAALGTDHGGHETVLCVADENYLGQPTAEIVEAVCGTLPERCDLEGRQAALSNQKARDLLGWEPKYTSVTADTDESAPEWV